MKSVKIKMKILNKLLLVVSAFLISPVAFGEPPAESGANVIRYESSVGLFFVDPDAGAIAVLGGDVAEFCSTGALDVVSVMRVNVPQDTDRIKRLVRGQVRASVWPFTEFSCSRFTTELPTAEGMVHIRNNDNDLVAFLRDNNNINSYGWKANGAMYSPSTGETFQFNLIFHALFDDLNDDDPGNDVYREMIKFALR